MFPDLWLFDFKHDRNTGKEPRRTIPDRVKTYSVHSWVHNNARCQLTASPISICGWGPLKYPTSDSPNNGHCRATFHISRHISILAAGEPRETSKKWAVIGGRVLAETWDAFPDEDSEVVVKCPPLTLTRSFRVHKQITSNSKNKCKHVVDRQTTRF